jgi:hypothetical protein
MDVIFWNGGIKWKLISRYIGPYKISHWIRKHGHTSQVIDFVDHLSEEQLYAVTTKFISPTTKILALSTTFMANNSYKWNDGSWNAIPESCVNVFKRIKEEHPSIKIIAGGYASDRVSGWGVVDATVMSYTTATEDIFLEYLEHLKTGSAPPHGQIIFPNWGNVNTRKHRMLYDRALNPRYNIEDDDFKWIKDDVILPGEPLPLDVSRGCIFACKFCQYPHLGKKKLDYIRGMNYIEDELRYNYENFGTTRYYMLDDTFNDTEFKMQEFYKMTQRLPFKIRFSAYLRADLIHRFPDMASLLQESGLFGAYHGIETLHPSASKLVGKAWSGTHAREWIPKLYHDIWNKKIPMHTNFIVGITSDTRENVLDTTKWFLDNNLHSIQFNALGLYGPGNNSSKFTIQSEFDKNAEKYGFTFTSDESTTGSRQWKNDNWTTGSAVEIANKAISAIKPFKKIHTWSIPSALWYGVSEEEIFNTPWVQLPWKLFEEKSAMLYQQYVDTLMAL